MSADEKAVALTQAEREALGYGIDYGTALAAVERILADRLQQAREEGAREALEELADAWTQGQWSDVMLPKPTPPAVPVIAYANRVGDWLRAQIGGQR